MLKKSLSTFTADRAIPHLPISREYRVIDFFPDVVQVHAIEGRRKLPDIAIVQIAIEDAAMTVDVGKKRSG